MSISAVSVPVVHNQHARASRWRNTDAWLDLRFDCGTTKRRHWQLDDEVTAVARTRALRLNRSSVQMHERPGDSETQAQSSARAVDCLPLLNICVEHGVEQFRRDTKPFVPHPELETAIRMTRADEDAGFSITVFRGIREQVGDDLRQAFPVAVDRKAGRRHIDCQHMPSLLQQRARDLDGPGNDFRQLDRLAIERELSSRDPRDVQQVVHEVGQMSHLPVDNG